MLSSWYRLEHCWDRLPAHARRPVAATAGATLPSLSLLPTPGCAGAAAPLRLHRCSSVQAPPGTFRRHGRRPPRLLRFARPASNLLVARRTRRKKFAQLGRASACGRATGIGVTTALTPRSAVAKAGVALLPPQSQLPALGFFAVKAQPPMQATEVQALSPKLPTSAYIFNKRSQHTHHRHTIITRLCGIRFRKDGVIERLVHVQHKARLARLLGRGHAAGVGRSVDRVGENQATLRSRMGRWVLNTAACERIIPVVKLSSQTRPATCRSRRCRILVFTLEEA